MKCIIVGSSKESQKDFIYEKEDLIIASDGGYQFLKENNYRIDIALGDFDSLGYVPEGVNLIRLNPIKDVSDTHAAIEEAIRRGYQEIDIYGCTGGRIDHSLALIQTAAFYAKSGIKIRIFASSQTITFIYNDTFTMEKEKGYISVFAIGEAKGVTLKKLKYELENKELTSDFPLGLSNEFINKKAVISVTDGCLMIVY